MEKLTQLLTDLLAEVKKAEAGPAEAPAPAPAPAPESDEEDFVDMPDSKSEADSAEAPAEAPAAPLPSAAQTIKDLEDLIDHSKDYDAAALIIQNRLDLRTEIFNFFAGRWWRDIKEWDHNEEAPKAILWEVLLLNNIVRWQDLWSIFINKIDSLGLIVLFRGTEKSRQHMREVLGQDPKFLEQMQGQAGTLMNIAAGAALPKVLPHVYGLFKTAPDLNKLTTAFNQASVKDNRELRTERTRQCLVYLANLMASAPVAAA